MRKDIITAHGYCSKKLLESELSLARKSIGQHLVVLVRLAVKLMKEEQGKSVDIDKFRKQFGQGRVNIQSIMNILKNSQYTRILNYLQQRIFLERKMRALIEVLGDVKASEKYVLREMA